MDHLRKREDEEYERVYQLVATSQTYQAVHQPLENEVFQTPAYRNTAEPDSFGLNCQVTSQSNPKAQSHGRATDKTPDFLSKRDRNGVVLSISPIDAETHRSLESDPGSNSAQTSHVTSATSSGPRTSATSAGTLISVEDDSKLRFQDEEHLSDSAQPRTMSPHWNDLRELDSSSPTTDEKSTSLKTTGGAPEGATQAPNRVPSTNHTQHVPMKIARKPVAKSSQGGSDSVDKSKTQIVDSPNTSPNSPSQVTDRLPQRSHSTQAPIAIEHQENNTANDSMFSDLSKIARVMGQRRSQGILG